MEFHSFAIHPLLRPFILLSPKYWAPLLCQALFWALGITRLNKTKARPLTFSYLSLIVQAGQYSASWIHLTYACLFRSYYSPYFLSFIVSFNKYLLIACCVRHCSWDVSDTTKSLLHLDLCFFGMNKTLNK